MSEQKEHIEKIFKEAFQSHEVAVGPEVWTAVQSSLTGLGTVSSAASGSLFLSKAAAVIGFAGLITASTIAEVQYHTKEHASAHNEVISEKEQLPADQQTVASFEESIASEESVIQEQQHETPQNEISVEQSLAEEEELWNDQSAISIQSDESTSDEVASNEEQAEGSDLRAHDKDEAVSSVDVASIQENTQKGNSKDEAQQALAEPIEEEHTESVQEKTTAYFTHNAEQVITPNGDPYNEYFEVAGYGVKDFSLRIMTRGGQLVFESIDIFVRWNGVDRFGNALPAGIYFYEIQAVGDDNLPYLERNAKGSITIVRN